MTIYTYATLNKAVENGEVGTCISINGARIIVPTDCKEVVGFTNPDDLDVGLLERWKKGERGPEFENQKLMPGDCLVLYDNGRNINQILTENPDWYKTSQGIKTMIEKLYVCAEAGGKNTEPAIWNSDLHWAESVKLTTSAGQNVTEDLWQEKCGQAIEAIKSPVKQNFVHVLPGDKLISPKGIVQTASSMSAIAVQQPDGNWNMVQLNAKGYAVIDEKINTHNYSNNDEQSKSADWLQIKQDALNKKLGKKLGKTGDVNSGEITDGHRKTAKSQVHISKAIINAKRAKEGKGN